MENRAGQELFSVALFYVITKGRAATFSDIEIFLINKHSSTHHRHRSTVQIERRLFTQPTGLTSMDNRYKRLTFRQNIFLQNWFRNEFGVGLG